VTEPKLMPSPGPWMMKRVAAVCPGIAAHQWVDCDPALVPHQAPRVFAGTAANAWASGTVAVGPLY
jgi:hypothetical protein